MSLTSYRAAPSRVNERVGYVAIGRRLVNPQSEFSFPSSELLIVTAEAVIVGRFHPNNPMSWR